MEYVFTFLTALSVSFIGSIPPGVINITAMQYALINQKKPAFIFSLTVTGIEFLYALIAVQFQLLLQDNTMIQAILQWITIVGMIVLGIMNIRKKHDIHLPEVDTKKRKSFYKGLMLGVTNPLSIPFWLAATSQLQNLGTITLDGYGLIFYLLGISTGTMGLLFSVIFLAGKINLSDSHTTWVHKIPGFLFLFMAAYSIFKWFYH